MINRVLERGEPKTLPMSELLSKNSTILARLMM
ncbi:MAG: hypothetical protein QG615_951 [Nitrospirota bacterium]|nr:hypothetical protein [Nitrospirota bacterium]